MNFYKTICALAATVFMYALGVYSRKTTTNSPWDIQWDMHYKRQKNTTDTKSIPFLRDILLYSKASSKHVQIINRTVDGRGGEASEFAKISVESDTFGRIKLRGVKTNRYLCMNRKGKLVGRSPAKNTAKEKRRKCIFKEQTNSGGFRYYQSVKYPKWYLAINKKGHAVSGHSSTKNKKNRQFLWRTVSGHSSTKNGKNRQFLWRKKNSNESRKTASGRARKGKMRKRKARNPLYRRKMKRLQRTRTRNQRSKLGQRIF